MSDQGWNTPGSPPQGPSSGWGDQPPPPQPGAPSEPPPPQSGQQWGQQPPPPQEQQWGQQPPPQEGGWGQPPQQQPGQQPAQWGQQPGQWGQQPGQWGQQPGASSGIDPKLAGILAYVPFGWMGGLVIYLVNKDPLSRFHGAQSILLSIASFAAFIAVTFLNAILPDAIAILFGLVMLVVWLGLFGLSIYLAVQAYNLKKVTLPLIGPIAEQWAVK